jgi:hypothetical protein
VRIALGLIGSVLILVVIYDVVWTTLRLTGGGPLTTQVTNTLWHLAVRVTKSHRSLSVAGFCIVLFTVLLWIGLTWISWTLVLNWNEGAVVDAQTGEPANFWARLYFAGYTLITMGNGDYRPVGSVWQVLTAVASGNGFFLITLIITYLLPLVTEEIKRRQIASHIHALGPTPQDILLRAWNGSGFGLLPNHLVELTFPMMALAQGHLAYPVLHCFHSLQRETALAPSIAALDEALTLLEASAVEQRPDPVAVYPLREAIERFLSTLQKAHLEPKSQPPPLPSLDRLRDAGVPTTDDGELRRIVEKLSKRRRLLLGLVEQEGWRWEDVTVARYDDETGASTRSPSPSP